MFRGSMVALITPMHADGSVDEASLARLVEFHLEQATDAIVAVGTTGESATLDEDEHCAVIRQVVELAAGRIPVIAGTGSNCTDKAIHMTEFAKSVGATAKSIRIWGVACIMGVGSRMLCQVPKDRVRPLP